jgi:hypothetical protein
MYGFCVPRRICMRKERYIVRLLLVNVMYRQSIWTKTNHRCRHQSYRRAGLRDRQEVHSYQALLCAPQWVSLAETTMEWLPDSAAPNYVANSKCLGCLCRGVAEKHFDSLHSVIAQDETRGRFGTHWCDVPFRSKGVYLLWNTDLYYGSIFHGEHTYVSKDSHYLLSDLSWIGFVIGRITEQWFPSCRDSSRELSRDHRFRSTM